MVVLEELEHARRRGAPIYGEILGYGSTADAYRITDIHPEGRGAIACMNMALKDARLSPETIDYVNAHGTSTSVNDRVETVACRGVFGEQADTDTRFQHQEHDGTPDRGRRCDRTDRLPAGHPRSSPATDDQLRKPRSGLRSGLRPQRSSTRSVLMPR